MSEVISNPNGRPNIDITGKRFGFLIAIRFSHTVKHHPHWIFKCDCGENKTINKFHVVSRSTVSCGCWGGGRNSHRRFGRPKRYKDYLKIEMERRKKEKEEFHIPAYLKEFDEE